MSTDTAIPEVLSLLGQGFPKCDSPSLRLGKFVRVGGNSKKDEVDAVVACHERRRLALKVRPFVPPRAVSFTAVLGGRLIVNQAGGVLENAGLCLHRHFGYPMIPGSAVKGIAAHAAWCQWRDEADPKGRRGLALQIATTFGYPTGDPMPQRASERAREPEEYLDEYLAREWPALLDPDSGTLRMFSGSVSFLPAVPADPARARLVTDIVNCHHPRYYQGKTPTATDSEDPNPQFFPTVEVGAPFAFSVVPLNRGLPPALAASLPPGFRPAEKAREWLLLGLCTWGAGAKTAAGYGWFLPPGTPAAAGAQPAPAAGLAQAGPGPSPLQPAAPAAGPDIGEMRKQAASTANFRLLLPRLAALDDETLRRLFPLVFADKLQDLERHGRRDPYWQSFASRPEAAGLLKRAGIVLK